MLHSFVYLLLMCVLVNISITSAYCQSKSIRSNYAFRLKISGQKSIATIVAIGISSLITPNLQYIVNAEEISSVINTVQEQTTSKLTAEQLLLTDTVPKINLLKDISLSFNQYESFVSTREYNEIRKALRDYPVVELRKTCKNLKKYLSLEKLKNFENSYSIMISSVDDLDGLALRRSRDENVPTNNKVDIEVINAINDAKKNLDELIKIAEN